jgi:hypothetical protein
MGFVSFHQDGAELLFHVVSECYAQIWDEVVIIFGVGGACTKIRSVSLNF